MREFDIPWYPRRQAGGSVEGKFMPIKISGAGEVAVAGLDSMRLRRLAI